MVDAEYEWAIVFRSVPARWRRWSLNRDDPLRRNGRWKPSSTGRGIDEAAPRQRWTLDVQLIVMIYQFIVVIVVFFFVIAIVAIGAGRQEVILGDWCYRSVARIVDIRKLEVDIVQRVLRGRRWTSVRVAIVAVEVLVLPGDEVEVVVSPSGGLFDVVYLLTAEDLRLRHVGTALQQGARRSVERMLAGLHLRGGQNLRRHLGLETPCREEAQRTIYGGFYAPMVHTNSLSGN